MEQDLKSPGGQARTRARKGKLVRIEEGEEALRQKQAAKAEKDIALRLEHLTGVAPPQAVQPVQEEEEEDVGTWILQKGRPWRGKHEALQICMHYIDRIPLHPCVYLLVSLLLEDESVDYATREPALWLRSLLCEDVSV
jgi:hypothetical protein